MLLLLLLLLAVGAGELVAGSSRSEERIRLRGVTASGVGFLGMMGCGRDGRT
jgi:hypothetical protein